VSSLASSHLCFNFASLSPPGDFFVSNVLVSPFPKSPRTSIVYSLTHLLAKSLTSLQLKWAGIWLYWFPSTGSDNGILPTALCAADGPLLDVAGKNGAQPSNGNNNGNSHSQADHRVVGRWPVPPEDRWNDAATDLCCCAGEALCLLGRVAADVCAALAPSAHALVSW
jgi:hypothetical protein